MRVLVLSPDFPPAAGGIQVVVHRFARHARARTRVVTLRSEGWRAFDAAGTLDVRRVPTPVSGKPAKALLNAWALAQAAAFRPDVVLSAHIVTSPAARAIRRLLGVPFVQYVHADEMRSQPHLAAGAAAHADAVLGVSRHSERLALAAGARADRVHRIPNGVDLSRAARAERAAEPTLLTVARLHDRHKGFDVVVRALPLVKEQVPGARWVLVGDGRLRPEIETLVRSHGLEDSVTFAGRVSDDERDAWLDRAHVFVMPSRLPPAGIGGEGFGIVYLEAGAHGLPVVAGNVGGAPDAVIDRETGVLVDPTDHRAVAEAVSELLLDRSRAEALGRAGEARARELAWPRIVSRVEDLLAAVAYRQANRTYC